MKITNQNLEYFLNTLTTLNRATNFGPAPHKPILLLSLIDLIEILDLQENEIPIDDELFQLFRYNWQLLTGNTKYKPDIAQPLHYLKNDGIWQLISTEQKVIETQIRSLRQLKQKVAFGHLENPLFDLLRKPEYRDLYRMTLLDTYFPETKINYLREKPLPDYITEIEACLLQDGQVPYRRRLSWEEGFVRDWKFRDWILKLYHHTCCISRLSVEGGVSLIEACHIDRFSEMGNNHPTNGMALNATLHRAFDIGLISLDDNYKVLLRRGIKEQESPYKIHQFKGKMILLPEDAGFFPDPAKLQRHRKRFGFS